MRGGPRGERERALAATIDQGGAHHEQQHHLQAGERGRSPHLRHRRRLRRRCLPSARHPQRGPACLCPAPWQKTPAAGSGSTSANVSARSPRSASAPIPSGNDAGKENRNGAVRGEREVPSRRDVRGCHTCSQQQPCGSSGRSAPCGLAQDALSRAVNVADREAGLARTLRHRVCGTPAPEARGRRVGPALPSRPARDSQHPGHRQDAPPCVTACARAEAGAVRRAPRMPTGNVRHPHDPAPGLPRLRDARLPHRHRRRSAPTPG